MTLLHTLPANDPERLLPLEGAWFRQSIMMPIDVTDSEEKRVSIRELRAGKVRKWLAWKRVVKWKIAKSCYNDLGSVWTNYAEWTFDNPNH